MILPVPPGYLDSETKRCRYAYKYSCPQVFCFDNSYLLLLQFRAQTVSDIKDPDCKVDCWVLPRENLEGTPLRYALYRLLAQGFRRCQGLHAMDVSINGVRPYMRHFFSGMPVWHINGRDYYAIPPGHRRVMDKRSGAFFWTDATGFNALVDENGNIVWDTQPFWSIE